MISPYDEDQGSFAYEELYDSNKWRVNVSSGGILKQINMDDELTARALVHTIRLHPDIAEKIVRAER